MLKVKQTTHLHRLDVKEIQGKRLLISATSQIIS